MGGKKKIKEGRLERGWVIDQTAISLIIFLTFSPIL